MATRRGILGAIAGLLTGTLWAKKAEAAPALPAHSPIIRLWNIHPVDGVLPSDEAFQKVVRILEEWDGKDDLNIIWDGSLSVTEVELLQGDTDMVVKRGDSRILRREPGPDNTMSMTVAIGRPRIHIVNRR